VATLGEKLWVCKLRDRTEEHDLCPVGEGEIPCRGVVEALGAANFGGWLVVEWDRAWVPGLAAAEAVLPGSLERVFEWAGVKGAPV
jgi:sugar phosphate isomerase/epimerase